MTRAQELNARADHFAVRADRARGRIARNTNLSIEQTYRNLATEQERSDAANRELEAKPQYPTSASAR